jgi:hypothetical protein
MKYWNGVVLPQDQVDDMIKRVTKAMNADLELKYTYIMCGDTMIYAFRDSTTGTFEVWDCQVRRHSRDVF